MAAYASGPGSRQPTYSYSRSISAATSVASRPVVAASHATSSARVPRGEPEDPSLGRAAGGEERLVSSGPLGGRRDRRCRDEQHGTHRREHRRRPPRENPQGRSRQPRGTAISASAKASIASITLIAAVQS